MKWLDKLVEKCVEPKRVKPLTDEERYERLRAVIDGQLKELYEQAKKNCVRKGI